MITNLIKEHAYLYSLWSGRFMVHEGCVFQVNSREEHYRFSVKNMNRGFDCSSEPQTIYNAVLWLPERDDELAKKLFIKYEEEAIALLQEKIDNHLHKIQILKGELL